MARGTDLYTRLVLDAKEFTKGLEDAKKETLGFGKNLTTAGKAVNGLKGFVGKLGVAIGVVGSAYEAFNKTIQSSTTLTNEWNGVIEGGKIATDRFFTALATCDWSNYLSGLSSAIQQGREFVQVLDSVQRFDIGYSVIEAQNRAKIDNAKRIIEDPTITDLDVKRRALTEVNGAISEMDVATEEAASRYDALSRAILEKYGGITNATSEMVDNLLTNIITDRSQEQKEFEAKLAKIDASNKKEKKEQKTFLGIPMPTADEFAKGLSQSQGSLVIDKETREKQKQKEALKKQYAEQAMYFAIKEKMSTEELAELKDAKVREINLRQARDSFKNSTTELTNKVTALTKAPTAFVKSMEKAQTPLQKINTMIDEVTKELQFPTDESDLVALRQLLVELQDKKKELERTIKIRVDGKAVEQLSSLNTPITVSPILAMGELVKLRKEVEGEIKTLQETLSRTTSKSARERLIGKISQKQSELDLYGDTSDFGVKLPNTSDYKSGIDGITSSNEQLVQSFGAINSIMSTLSATFDDSAGGALAWASSLIGAIGQVITATVPLIAVRKAEATANAEAAATGAASSVAGIPFVGPALAISAVLALIATIAKAPKFATGGVVGGNSYYGDKILARVNSGELILNKQQQASLYNHLAGAGMPQSSNSEVEFKIRGQELVGILNKYDRRTSRS